MSKRKILIIAVIFILVVFAVYGIFFRKTKPSFTLVKVARDNISQEVSASGVVKQGEEINLAFKNSGRVEKILVKVGDQVKSGETLAQLDSIQLAIQLKNAKAALEVSQASLDKLLAGPTQEEINIQQTDVQNSQIALDTAKENLSQAYEDGLNTLNAEYLKFYTTLAAVDTIQHKYFISNDQESINFRDNKNIISRTFDDAKSVLDIAKADNKNENIDSAFSKMKNSGDIIAGALTALRSICEQGVYYSTVSSTDKTALDTQRTNINTALTNIIDAQQTISSKQFSVDSAAGSLQAAKDDLALMTAKPRQEDIDLYEAQVEQAKSEENLLEAQIEDAILKSPTDGKITQVNKSEGEISVAAESVVSLLSDSPFEVKVDIYEEDVVKINIGNPVDINLTAFSNVVLKGKVILINPDQTLKEGVVYYETTIDFENPPEKIKPGMTADIDIITATKENVLIIPHAAVQEVNGKITVQVLNGKNLDTRQIEIGIKGSNDMVEVISGLKEGEEVVIKD